MKPHHSTTLAPVMASVVLLCSMGLFALAPQSSRVWRVPEANNGGLYCRIDPRRQIPVTAFRTGNVVVFGRPVTPAGLKEVLRSKVAEIHDLDMASILRLRMDPEISMVHVRRIYEAAEGAGVDSVLIRVVLKDL